MSKYETNKRATRKYTEAEILQYPNNKSALSHHKSGEGTKFRNIIGIRHPELKKDRTIWFKYYWKQFLSGEVCCIDEFMARHYRLSVLKYIETYNSTKSKTGGKNGKQNNRTGNRRI